MLQPAVGDMRYFYVKYFSIVTQINEDYYHKSLELLQANCFYLKF